MATRQSTDTRAKDSDRNDTCQVLDSALSEGQLSMEEHRQRVGAATNATTLGELQSLVSDLQTANAPVQRKRPNRIPTGGWGTRIAVGVVLVLLGIGIGRGVYGNTSSPLSFTSDPGAKPDGIAPIVLTPPKQLQSLNGLTGLIEQARRKFGDTFGYRVVVYPDYAVLDRTDPNDNRRKLSYTYRGGWGSPSSDGAAGTDDVLVDLSKFDAATVVGVLRGAPQTLGIKASDVTSTYLIVEPTKDPTTPGALALSVYVSSDFGSGYMELDGQGNVSGVHPPS
ncbi:DUF1707 domain-containing protein [Mycobacterium sp.]|uniref:DUF1707 SHOCT-like domain-containing protein n=1 Tax=Mycobacterium sp. TaxID=1785 RepID=UPI002CE15A10|nr:DUF1707 domain-containing protein [Mycobacterium sp.]HME47930.1 DUF1707 domain-containing protein [Mycobacterium sp.]